MYSNIKVYQKYLVTSIKVGCATRSLYASSGPEAEGDKSNKNSISIPLYFIFFMLYMEVLHYDLRVTLHLK